ncbi:MAG: SDR family NAD(P)-dependent oxidoreductase [Saprospirales bacterium]|nr:SDR family NAD(P)-dependent oxidoreductase [Saprospirales bacterium]
MNAFKEKYGQYAVITGGTSGIGKALAGEIAKRGVDLVLVARGSDELAQTAQSLHTQYGVDVKTIAADLSNSEGVEKILRETDALEIGLFVPAAGFETNGLFSKTDIQKELMVLQVNVVSTLALTHHYAKKMVDRKRGGILLVSSLSGHMPNPYFANYAGAKAYVLNLGLSCMAS